MDLTKIKRIHFIGIKGVGMTMLAQFLANQEIKITGSDTAEKFMTDEILAKAGIKVIEEFSKNNLVGDIELIIYSSAYNPEKNSELAAALASEIKTITYAQALGEVFNQRHGIAVVGSHGKTTTTAWLGYTLNQAGLKPSVMVGANVPQFNGASLISEANYLVIEADEYQNKLQYFNPKAVLLNNIDYDHPDFFPTKASYEQVFADFIKKIPKSGFLVANFDDKIVEHLSQINCQAKLIAYGLAENNTATIYYQAYDCQCDKLKQYFKIRLNDNGVISELGDFSISLLGEHNIYNALAVIATNLELGVSLYDLRKYLTEFLGTARRLQLLGEFKGAKIYDDYAHHPTEIKATISAIRQKYKTEKIILVFHPHTFSRTKILFNDFVDSFSGVNELIILDIYGSAREQQGGVSSQELVEAIKNKYPNFKVINLTDLKICEDYLRQNILDKEIVVLMGAGDVFRIGERLLK